MKRLIGILIGGLIFSFGCTKAYIDETPVVINTNIPDTTATDTVVTHPKYNPDVQSLMFSRCVTCHGGGAPSAGLALENYSSVRNSAEFGTLMNRINDPSSPMPPSGLLPDNDRAMMDNWVTDGFPEN